MAPEEMCKHTGPRVLLVEGSDDCHVVMALCNQYNVPESFGLYVCGSDEKVLKRMNALILQPETPETIGVMLDTDSGIESRWRSIQGRLRNHGYELPQAAAHMGTIIEAPENKPRIGIWLMPDNQLPGMLEDFCATMIEQSTLAYVQHTVAAAKQAGHCTYKDVHFSKAVVHTYLSWQDEPGHPLGQAISKTALRPDTPTATVFIGWLNRLFNT